MIISEITCLGDKIDIQLEQQLEQQEKGENAGPVRIYKSSLFDYLQDMAIEIAMPTENGRMVLFQVGLRCKMIFYSKKGLFSCYGVVKKRYKKDNFYVLEMQITSNPVKYQRRKFFRIENAIDLMYIPVEEETAMLQSTEALFAEIQRKNYMAEERKAVSIDISGGGIRFVSEEPLEKGSYVIVIIRLTNNKIDQMFYLVTQIIESAKSAKGPGKYIQRGQFLYKDLKDREMIVRYVFEEERCIRKKEMA